MSCSGCYEEITPTAPFTETFKVPWGGDLVIKLPAISDDVAFNWDDGELTMRIFDSPSLNNDSAAIKTFDDSRWTRSQTDESDEDSNITWDDVVTIILEADDDDDLGDLDVLRPYWGNIIFDHTNLNISIQLGRFKLIKDNK